jgi:hypothetical protein
LQECEAQSPFVGSARAQPSSAAALPFSSSAAAPRYAAAVSDAPLPLDFSAAPPVPQRASDDEEQQHWSALVRCGCVF